MSGPTVRVDHEDQVAVLTMDDEASRNGLSPKLRELLMDAFDACCHDESHGVEAVVITGANGCFSAGSDIAAMLAQSPADREERLRRFQAFLAGWLQLPMPVLVAVEGAAAGGAVSIALAADWAVAATDAIFVSGWLSIGLLPDAGAAWWLVRAMGEKAAFDWIHSTARMTASDAVAAGMITASCPPGQARQTAVARAKELIRLPAVARGEAKLLLRSSALGASLRDFLELEAAAQSRLFVGDEHRALVEKFLNRGR